MGKAKCIRRKLSRSLCFNSAALESIGICRKSEVDLFLNLNCSVVSTCLLNGNNAFHFYSACNKPQEELE